MFKDPVRPNPLLPPRSSVSERMKTVRLTQQLTKQLSISQHRTRRGKKTKIPNKCQTVREQVTFPPAFVRITCDIDHRPSWPCGKTLRVLGPARHIFPPIAAFPHKWPSQLSTFLFPTLALIALFIEGIRVRNLHE